MTEPPLQHVVIVGGGTAGWMCAAALARIAPTTLRITLIEAEDIGTIGVGEATIPTLTSFNEFVGLDEDDLIREAGATFKLGIEFADWRKLNHSYFHPFGPIGLDTQDSEFHQLWLRAAHEPDGAAPVALVRDIGSYSLCQVAAKLGRFARGNESDDVLIGSMRHAFHFDAARYAHLLRKIAEARGVTRLPGTVAHVVLRPDNGFIGSLTLASGQSIGGDFFVDCTGFRRLLLNALGARFEDWSDHLPCDRAMAVATQADPDPLPYTRATADLAGWRWRIPLQQRTGNGLVYSSAFLSDAEAEARLAAGIGDSPLEEPRLITFQTGRVAEPWIKNCVGIGLSAGFIEPLESTGIHLIQSAVEKLVRLFPGQACDPADTAEYNRQLKPEYEQIRDFIMLHYFATERDDTAFWRSRRHTALPQSLQEKIALFRSKGRIFRRDADLFSEDSWLAVMLGQGIMPRSYDSLVDRYPLPDLTRQLSRLHQGVLAAAESLPRHAAILAQINASVPGTRRPAARTN